MPVDASIYLQQQAPDILGGIQKGLQVKQQMSEQKEADRQRDTSRAISGAYTKDPTTGAMTFDTSKIDPSANIDNSKVAAAQQNYAAAQAAHQEALHKMNMAHAEEAAPVILSMNDPDSFQAGIARLKASKNPLADEIGDQYDPQKMKAFQAQATPVAQHFAKQAKDAEMLDKGYQPGDNGTYFPIPGGKAELGNKKTAAETAKTQAEADAAPAKTKAEIAHLNAEAGKENATAQFYGSDKIQKQIDNLKKDLDPNQARGGNFAKSQAMINTGDRIDALFKQFPDYNVPKAQTTELTSAIAGMVNGGSAQSQHQIDTMTPSSLRGDANGIASWLTNNPRGQEQQAYMKMMHDSALRERDVAAGQVKQAQVQRIAAYGHLKQRAPEDYQSLLDSYGISDDDMKNYGPGGGKRQGAKPSAPAAAGSHPQDSQAVAWAKANLKGDPATTAKAQQILQLNGAQ